MSKTVKIILFLISAFVVTLFLVSPDAPTHTLWCRCDSAWFFMCGKAWMNGLTPYVDFTDSKGPLLWLIYGIGYLISHNDYTGVFCISAVVYAVIAACTFATARMFLNSDRRALLVGVLMLMAYFYPQVHFEVRCEDFNLMFITIALWQTCRLLYTDAGKNKKARQCRSAALWCGIGMAATLLIKYNASPMFLPFVLAIAWWARRNRQTLRAPLVRILAGITLVVTPFIILLAWQGALQAFWQEYFVNTFDVVGRSHNAMGSTWQRYLKHWVPLTALLGGSVLGALWIGMQTHRYRLFPLLTTLTIAGISYAHATWTYQYGICLILPIFAVIALMRTLGNSPRPRWATSPVSIGIVTIIMVGVVTCINWHKNGEGLWYKNDPRNADFKRFTAIMRQVPNPTVLYYFTGPAPEHGIENGSLPACKYWASQSGATTLMNELQREAARNGKADFIFAIPGSKAAAELSQMGYHCHECTCPEQLDYRLNLYTRHTISEPAK